MKDICTITIALPLEKVVTLWSNALYFKEWQDGFESLALLSVKPEAVGAKSKIKINGKHKFEQIETILVRNLPHEKKALYEHVHMTNTQTTRFEALDPQQTKYTSEVEYTQFNSFMIKLVAKLFPGKFKAQSQKWMDQFKVFAENQRG